MFCPKFKQIPSQIEFLWSKFELLPRIRVKKEFFEEEHPTFFSVFTLAFLQNKVYKTKCSVTVCLKRVVTSKSVWTCDDVGRRWTTLDDVRLKLEKTKNGAGFMQRWLKPLMMKMRTLQSFLVDLPWLKFQPLSHKAHHEVATLQNMLMNGSFTISFNIVEQ